MATITSTNPSDNYKELGSIKTSTLKEIKDKVAKARKATESWGNIPVKERVTYLKDLYDKLKARSDEISKLASSEMGFPIRDQKMFDMGDGFTYFEWYLNNAERLLDDEITHEDKKEIHKVVYEPYGVATVIQPWNFPFCQWSWAVVPNLIAGNTVVFKHSEECPLTGKLIEDIANKSKLPKGVFNEIYGAGDTGERLLDQEIDLITFTGSFKVGQKIYKKAASKFIKVLLELGGSAPGIVFKDADINSAVEHIFALRFTNCGQACDGLKRLIIHKSIFNEVIEKLKNLVETVKIGPAVLEDTDIGPLVAKRQLRVIEAQFKDAVRKGAKVATGGEKPKGLQGAYFKPTLLTNIKRNMKVWKEEVFGPILPVIVFKSEEEAVELANDTEYGLGGYIYSKNTNRAERIARKLKTGMISINGVNYVCPHNPFGGYKHSGIGREHGSYGLHDVSQIKVIVMNK